VHSHPLQLATFQVKLDIFALSLSLSLSRFLRPKNRQRKERWILSACVYAFMRTHRHTPKLSTVHESLSSSSSSSSMMMLLLRGKKLANRNPSVFARSPLFYLSLFRSLSHLHLPHATASFLIFVFVFWSRLFRVFFLSGSPQNKNKFPSFFFFSFFCFFAHEF